MLNITVEPNPNKVQFKERRGIDFEGSELQGWGHNEVPATYLIHCNWETWARQPRPTLRKKNLRYELILSWQVGPHLRVGLLIPPISLVVTGQQAARAGTTSIRWRQKLGVGKTWGANASERCDTCMRPETYISLCTEPFQHEVSLYAARSAFSFLFYLMYQPDKAIYSLPKPSVICYRLAVSYMQPR